MKGVNMGKLTVINAADILTGPELPLSLESDYEEQAYRRGINHAICIASDLVRAGATADELDILCDLAMDWRCGALPKVECPEQLVKLARKPAGDGV